MGNYLPLANAFSREYLERDFVADLKKRIVDEHPLNCNLMERRGNLILPKLKKYNNLKVLKLWSSLILMIRTQIAGIGRYIEVWSKRSMVKELLNK